MSGSALAPPLLSRYLMLPAVLAMLWASVLIEEALDMGRSFAPPVCQRTHPRTMDSHEI